MARREKSEQMQFTDLNEHFQPFQRKYTVDIIKIQDIERQVKAMEDLLDSYGVTRDTEIRGDDLKNKDRVTDTSRIVEAIGKEIGDAYTKLTEQASVEQGLKKQYLEQEDSVRVLAQIDMFLQSENEAQQMLRDIRQDELRHVQAMHDQDRRSPQSVPLLEVTDADQRDVGFKYFAGVVTIAQRVSFERQIFLSVEQGLKKQYLEQEALVEVLSGLDSFLLDQRELVQERLGSGPYGVDRESLPLIQSADRDADQRDVGFKYFAGVVTIAQRVSFERQIFLTSRGNSFVQFDDSVPRRGGGDGDHDEEDKIPFVVFFLGDQLKRSFKRLCVFMNIQICYESDDVRSRDDLKAEANSNRDDYYRIQQRTWNQLEKAMVSVSASMRDWKIALYQEKAIRITLNQFSLDQANFLRAEGWCPREAKEVIQDILDDITRNKGVGRPIVQDANPRHGQQVVPTHFELNGFTEAFQSIVDTYGVPRYKEFNPAVPTIMTFPFLFAVMYGDVFHGSFILLAGLFLVFMNWRYDWLNSRDETLQSAAGARWMLLLMGCFAVYCGLIYNDVMSIMINGFNKSQWGYGIDTASDAIPHSVVYFQKRGVYAFGIDPVWHSLDNQLAYANSLKMKLSVIIGVTQMTYGLFLKLGNHLQEGDYISIWFEFVPQLIFMMSFFGYMCFLIVFKWCIDWQTSTLPATPSLITVLIRMVLGINTMSDEVQLFEDGDLQKTLQLVLVILMGISVPWMLVFKPLLLRSKHEREMRARRALGVGLNVDAARPGLQQGGYGQLGDEERGGADEDEEKEQPLSSQQHAHDGEEFDMSEIVIHQLIHTIEYVLGTVSNTASYLRLWALSLAHAQLSDVFFTQTVVSTISSASFVQVLMCTVGQFVFLMATIGVLLVMDVLECFLHALRLHWVEFQNKFFYADGVPFKPFSYKSFFDSE
eukprot:CAMPEP_0202726484 /NCGR_PEP_ID=MMETSP1385-20130828/184635_1 /ASSEMBLY_ACC=CAM_ASM_000861 /TAXON_ID=933848 /ORGANISM="Elphidium margaritaceum" /LENGTH=933 /DNA_ID=CAMNT_0049392705 /DNA_START=150 /DNA_END=2951 /DNA_ORIENTATION=+